jgi:hypothetical protein
LSVALLAFARLFSLRPDQALLAGLRREFLASSKAASAGDTASSGEEKTEAKALALVSALDKGVVLSHEALERYVGFLLPWVKPEAKPGASEDREHSLPKGDAVSSASDKESRPDMEELPQADELRAIAETEADKDDLLDFMNLLPGKNGQYWVVLPFNIKVKGVELNVVLRVLKRENGSVSSRFSAGEGEYLIADIVGPKKRWRWFLKMNAGKIRADIRVYPELSARALKALAKDAKRFFGEGSAAPGGLTGGFGGFEEILIQNWNEVPSLVEDLCGESLPSVSEEV